MAREFELEGVWRERTEFLFSPCPVVVPSSTDLEPTAIVGVPCEPGLIPEPEAEFSGDAGARGSGGEGETGCGVGVTTAFFMVDDLCSSIEYRIPKMAMRESAINTPPHTR
jgi:hypothetical protein